MVGSLQRDFWSATCWMRLDDSTSDWIIACFLLCALCDGGCLRISIAFVWKLIIIDCQSEIQLYMPSRSNSWNSSEWTPTLTLCLAAYSGYTTQEKWQQLAINSDDGLATFIGFFRPEYRMLKRFLLIHQLLLKSCIVERKRAVPQYRYHSLPGILDSWSDFLVRRAYVMSEKKLFLKRR